MSIVHVQGRGLSSHRTRHLKIFQKTDSAPVIDWAESDYGEAKGYKRREYSAGHNRAISLRSGRYIGEPPDTLSIYPLELLFLLRPEFRKHKVKALTRWYDHDLDVVSEPVEQDILQYLRA